MVLLWLPWPGPSAGVVCIRSSTFSMAPVHQALLSLSPETGTGRNCSPGDHPQSQSEQLPRKEQAPVVPCGDERRCGAVHAASQAGAMGSTLPCPSVPRGRSLLLSLCEKEGAQNVTESHFPQFCNSKPRHFEKSFSRADHHTAFCP